MRVRLRTKCGCERLLIVPGRPLRIKVPILTVTSNHFPDSNSVTLMPTVNTRVFEFYTVGKDEIYEFVEACDE